MRNCAIAVKREIALDENSYCGYALLRITYSFRRMAVPKIIALAQQKGGVGKSTLAIHIAVELTQRQRVVAIVDMDPQGTVWKWRSRRKAEWPKVAVSNVMRLSETVEDLSRSCEFILLDLPGRRGPDVTAGLRLANVILVPARPLDIDIEASGDTIAAAQRLGKAYAFVMTAVPPGSRRVEDYISSIRARGFPAISSFIVERIDYPDAIASGMGISEYRPGSKAGAEMSVFTTEILKGLKS